MTTTNILLFLPLYLLKKLNTYGGLSIQQHNTQSFLYNFENNKAKSTP
jgi:hypothetical protein